MDVKKAIAVFKKKYPNKRVVGYSSYQKCIVLITEFTGDLESNYYIVVDEKHILPTNPILVDLDEKKVIRI